MSVDEHVAVLVPAIGDTVCRKMSIVVRVLPMQRQNLKYMSWYVKQAHSGRLEQVHAAVPLTNMRGVCQQDLYHNFVRSEVTPAGLRRRGIGYFD
jgi:hypothetical protein